ncbi:hypothetical protein HYU45_04590 [Candidatus Daviesbacteria bacterium]|nr:hypothetical protein [Candidatus Daviesbacteria bacterium]
MNCEYSGKKVIVEIGPGDAPVLDSFREVTSRVAGGTAKYLAIDKYKPRDSLLRPKLFVQGAISSIPLLSDTVDELWLMNVFAVLRLKDDFDCSPVRNQSGISSQDRHYLGELARVTKLGGIINIGEYYNPDIVKWLMEIDYKDFALEKTVFTDVNLAEFLKKYQMIPERVSLFFKPPYPDTFFMTLTKV